MHEIDNLNGEFPALPFLAKAKSHFFDDYELPILKKYQSDDMYILDNYFDINNLIEENFDLDALPFFENGIPEEHLELIRIRPVPDNILLREFPYFNDEIVAEYREELNNQEVPPQIPVEIIEIPEVNDEEFPFGLFDLFDESKVPTLDEIFIGHLKDFPFYTLEKFDPHTVKCHICITKKEDFHHLGCSDHFCTTCIGLLLDNYISTSYVFPDEILCPMCLKTIPDEIIKKFTIPKVFKKMLALRESLKIQKLVAEGKVFYCPHKGCEGFGHIILNEKITACTKCRTSLCTACKEEVHPGITCEAAKELTRDDVLEEFLLSQNWKKCPTCGSAVEKIDGCQFITCHSPVCKGKNALCYLCGRFVIEAQHFSHYKTKGPFGDTCNTLDGIKEDVDPTTLVPILDAEAPNIPEGGENEE